MGFPWVGTPTGDLEKGQAFIYPSLASPTRGHPQTENTILVHWFFLLMYQEKAQRAWGLAWHHTAARGQQSQVPGPESFTRPFNSQTHLGDDPFTPGAPVLSLVPVMAL